MYELTMDQLNFAYSRRKSRIEHELNCQHKNLGDLQEILIGLPAHYEVLTCDGYGLDRPHSYRGYYDHLAFEPAKTVSDVSKLLDQVTVSLTHLYEGYKGGLFAMKTYTPIWISHFGESSGDRIVGFEVDHTAAKLNILLSQER
jgi:hypothetical protein